MKIEEKIKEALKKFDYSITITQSYTETKEGVEVDTVVSGIDLEGDKHSFTHTEYHEGALSSEVFGFKNEPEIKKMMLSESIDWFFWNNNTFQRNFDLSSFCKKYPEYF